MDFKSKGLDQELDSIASLTTAVNSVELDVQNSTNTVATTFISGMLSDTGTYFRPTIEFMSGTSVIPHGYCTSIDGTTSYGQNSTTGNPINFTDSFVYTSSGTYNLQFTGWIHKSAPFTNAGQKLTHINIRSIFYDNSNMKSVHFQASSINNESVITSIRFSGGSYGPFTYALRSYSVIIED
jgi:hypothetical protein